MARKKSSNLFGINFNEIYKDTIMNDYGLGIFYDDNIKPKKKIIGKKKLSKFLYTRHHQVQYGSADPISGEESANTDSGRDFLGVFRG